MAHDKILTSDYFQRLNKDGNNSLIKMFEISMIAGFIVATSSEIALKKQDFFTTRMIIVNIVFVIMAAIPFLLRSLKVKENIITHVLSILFLVDYGFILVVFSKTAAMTVWAMGLILIISSMFFVNRVVLLYSSIGCLTFSIICYFKIPTMSVKFEVDDHIGRIGILIIATMLAVIA